jgi:hypothetical protein
MMPPSLRKGLGDHMIFLWDKRESPLVSDLAILGWMVSVVPAIMLDAKTYDASHRERAERALRQLWYPQSAVEDQFQTNLNKFFFELGQFHKKEGPYSTQRIWFDTFAQKGQSHLWHMEHTMRYKYTSLGFTACRVASKILGIGAAERSWGDVKRIIGDRRLSLASEKINKQAIIYTSNCIQAKRRELSKDANSWKEWDLAMDNFNKSLEQDSFAGTCLDPTPPLIGLNQEEGFFGHFIQGQGRGNTKRVFKAYEEESLEKNQSKEDTVIEAAIIAKYGGLYLADPDLDELPVLLRINSERVFYQPGKRGPNRSYCVYGMGPGESIITSKTE